MSDADYLHQISQLLKLQEVDDKIYEVRQEMENAPRNLEKLEQDFHAIESRRNHILDKLEHLKDQKKRLSLEIDDDSAKIKKSRNKMMQVGNTREYQAMIREMDSMEQINRTREEEKITLLEELQTQTDALAEIDVDYNKIRTEFETRQANLEITVREANEHLDVLNKKREEASRDIPAPIFMRYEFIRKRLENPVIVYVDDGICSGCHIAIPPQSYIELQSGQQILSCPNCQRLIFWRDHFDMPETGTKADGGQKAADSQKEEESEQYSDETV